MALSEAAVGALIKGGAAVAGAGVSAYASGQMNRRAEKFNREEAEKQRTWNENMAEKQNAWNYRLWQEALDYDKPENQLQRLKDAGLNPLYFGLDGNSAAAFQGAAQPLGYERAQAPNYQNPASAGIGAFTELTSLAKDIQLKNAQIDKLSEEATGTKLDNQFKDMTMSARAEGVELANNATREQIAEVKSRVKVNEEEVKKKIEETKNEVEKRGLIMAETVLAKANAGKAEAESKSILELLPLQKLLSKAQTEAQKASASASYASAAINKGLLDSGYVEKQIDSIVADIAQKDAVAKSAEAQRAINDWKLSVRNGTVFDSSSYGTGVQRVLAQLTDGFFGMVSTMSEAVGGGLSGFIK